MCQIIETEYYLHCNHSFPTNLKYGLRYCSAPNGIPFTNPEVYTKRCMFPTRFCDEEKWQPLTLRISSRCPECEKMAKKDRRERRMIEGKSSKGRVGGQKVGGGVSDSSSSSSSSSSSIIPDEDYYAGEMMVYGCKCDQSIYQARRLQECFVRKPLGVRSRPGSSSGVLSRNGSTPQQTKTLPVCLEDWDFARNHHIEGNFEFSWEKYRRLRCKQVGGGPCCGNCYRRCVVAGNVDMDDVPDVSATKFGKTKLERLFVFPDIFAKKVAVRGPV